MQFKFSQQSRRIPLVFAGILAASIGLGGCAGSDVELNLPGLRGVTLGAKKKEEKVAVRGGLVIPPSTRKLPDPNKVAARDQQNQQACPDDPDERKKRIAALKKKEAKLRKEGFDKDGKPDFEALQDGGNSCPVILDKLLSGKLFN